MKPVKTLLLLCALAASTFLSQAQPVLSVDFNIRSNDPSGLTFTGFQSFQINSNVPGPLNVPSVRTYGAYTVTLSNVGNTYDDRLRGTPTDSGAFTQSRLLRDFVFSRDTGSGGLDVLVEGLNPGQEYAVTVWSYDSGSLNPTRYSDWSVNGTSAVTGYFFTGTPATDADGQFTARTVANGSGQVLISGRRNATLTPASQVAVFLNAFQISQAFPPAIIVQPLPAKGYAGDNVILKVASSGTGPLSFQWYRDGSPIDDATNAVLNLFNLQAQDDADYAVVVSNTQGQDTSSQVHVTVLPVESIFTGLVSHWALDVLGNITPDATTNHNDLFQYGMDSTFLVPGTISNAVAFSNPTGTTNYLVREHTNSVGLPIYNNPSYTVAFWVKANGTQTDRRVYAEGANTNNNPLFSIGTPNTNAGGVVNMYIRNDAGGVLLNHAKSSLVAFDDTWHHVAWVDNNGFGSIFVDGVKDTNAFNYTKGTFGLNVTALGTVYRTNGVVASLTGSVDDVAVWRRSLSAAEIQFVMANSLPNPQIVAIALAEGGVTLTYKTPAQANPRVEQLSAIGGTWTPVENVFFSPYESDTFRAQFIAPEGSQRFYRLVY